MRGQMLEKTRGNGRGYPFNEIRGVQTHFSHQIPTRSRHPSFISKYGFLSEAGTVWQRGRAGIGGGLLPLGIWTFLRAENSPQCFGLTGEYSNAGRSRCSDVRRLEVETQLYLNHLYVKLSHLILT